MQGSNMNTNHRSRTFQIALGGICLALTVLFMFGGTVVPGIDLTLFAISSLFTAVMIIETGIGGGALLFIAACLLGFFLLPNKLAILPYVCFFGYWPILKLYLEKISAPAVQIVCKCAVFALILCILLLGFREVFAQAVDLPGYPAVLLIPGGIALLLLYDYVLTLLIGWYNRRIKHIGNDHLKLS